MVRGLYTAYTGMRNEQKRLDIISNNVANAATVGYKAEGVTNQSFDELLTYKINDKSVGYDENIGEMSLGVKIGEAYTDYSQGSLRDTGSTFDFAIEGNGFFQVSVTDTNGNNSVKLTRNGSFTMTYDGYVVDEDGNHLLDENGNEVRVNPTSTDIQVNIRGRIFVDGEYTQTIGLTDFENYDYIEKYGDNLYQTVDGATVREATGNIRQGFTEQSNVNVVSEMVDMITITRAYETNQKMIKTVDSMIDKAVNEVGKV